MNVKMKKAGSFLIAGVLTVALAAPSLCTTAEAAKIKLNKTKVYLLKGQTVKLKVTGTKKKVTWKSSKKKVATVSKKGKVKAKKAGKTTITAKVKGKKYKCKIIVETKKQRKTRLKKEAAKKAAEKAKKEAAKKAARKLAEKKQVENAKALRKLLVERDREARYEEYQFDGGIYDTVGSEAHKYMGIASIMSESAVEKNLVFEWYCNELIDEDEDEDDGDGMRHYDSFTLTINLEQTGKKTGTIHADHAYIYYEGTLATDFNKQNKKGLTVNRCYYDSSDEYDGDPIYEELTGEEREKKIDYLYDMINEAFRVFDKKLQYDGFSMESIGFADWK